MAMLGDIIATARRSAGAFEAWLRESDPELAARLADAAADMGLGPRGLCAHGRRRFFAFRFRGGLGDAHVRPQGRGRSGHGVSACHGPLAPDRPRLRRSCPPITFARTSRSGR